MNAREQKRSQWGLVSVCGCYGCARERVGKRARNVSSDEAFFTLSSQAATACNGTLAALPSTLDAYSGLLPQLGVRLSLGNVFSTFLPRLTSFAFNFSGASWALRFAIIFDSLHHDLEHDCKHGLHSIRLLH
eukprot:36511-Pleurochrysis_carterae.AAC.1